MSRTYRALILNDYKDTPYAEWVKTGRKTIETRMKRQFSYRGDLVICCGKTNSIGANAGKALCIVNLYDAGPMQNTAREITAAGIGWDPKGYSHYLRNWRHFSRDFEFAPQATKKNFQGIFEITIPEDVEIIPRPDIRPFYLPIEAGGGFPIDFGAALPPQNFATPLPARGDKPAGLLFSYEGLVAAARKKYPELSDEDGIKQIVQDFNSMTVESITGSGSQEF